MRTLWLAMGLSSLIACGPQLGGTGGGSGGGSGGGTGGGGGASDRTYYKVTGVQGTYGGSATRVDPSRTDSLADVNCTYSSTGTSASQNPFVADPAGGTWSKGLTLSGMGSCPSVSGTSSVAGACTTTALNASNALLSLTIEIAGFASDSQVTFKANGPPTGQPSCNLASVLNDVSLPWGLEGTTTMGKFRAGTPFDVRMTGNKTLTKDTNTSSVHWDLTVTILPTQ